MISEAGKIPPGRGTGNRQRPNTSASHHLGASFRESRFTGLASDLDLSRCCVPVTRVPETRVKIVVIIENMLLVPINTARLAMLPLMLLCWALAWSLRYVPLPIKNPLLRVPVQLIYAFGFGASTVGQLFVFRSRAGIKGELFRNDNLSFMIVAMADLVGLWLVFNSVAVQRKKQQSARRALEKDDLHLRATP
jgi:hypothetical protein